MTRCGGNDITADRAGLGSRFGCSRTGRMGALILLCRADRAFVPMSALIFLPLRTVIVCYRSDFTADVAVGVAGIVIDVLCFVKLLTMTARTFVPVVRCVTRPCIGGGVSCVARGRGNDITADRADLRCCLRCGSSCRVGRLILFGSADRAGVPMSGFIAEPFLRVAVRYRACIAAEIAGGIAGMIKEVIRFILLCSARGTLVPVLAIVLKQRLRIAVGGFARSAAGVAGSIASIVKDVIRLFLFGSADRAFVPMLGLIL